MKNSRRPRGSPELIQERTIAIDSGKSGGIAYRHTDGSVHAVPMSDIVAGLDRLLRVLVCPESVRFIEDLPMYRGKMNLRSAAVLFRNFEQIEDRLASLKCRVGYLKPDWWQKQLRLGKSADYGDRWKAHLKGRAQALFLRVAVALKTADSLLILEAGSMTNKRAEPMEKSLSLESPSEKE